MSEEDDYWNYSEVKVTPYSFDDDELSSQQFFKLGAEVRAGLDESSSLERNISFDAPKQTLLPLHSVISDKALQKILLAQAGIEPAGGKNIPSEASFPSVSIALKRLVIGRPCSLYHHKSLKSKIQLLDGAIAIGDGNVILVVILFLVQTLKKKLVFQMLSSRPAAVSHYIGYLMTRLKTHDLVDLLTMLGRSGEAAMKQYQMIMMSAGSSIDVLLNKLKNLQSNHFTQPNVEQFNTTILTNYIKLLEWQKCMGIIELNNKSALRSLSHCCSYHWAEGSGKIASPQTFCQQQQICPQQYEWTALNVHAVHKNWEILETMFIKKNFLGRTTLACSIPLPKVIGLLKELGANTILLAVYLNYVTSVEQRLELAKKHKVHRTVIDCLVLQKDRQALTQYKMTLHPQSEEYFHAENALRTSTVTWKK